MRTHPTATHYRPDIDGLRAIAVMGVVLYHADARLIPGGFVGVDVFFVISGFLITTILLKQMDEGTLSIKTFYERRIRRIMPALFAMMGLVLLFGVWRMTPWDLKELAGSAKYAVCSVANLFFHRVTTGYFAESVDNMPLLHTWSLGVEEQFYVLFPLILMVAMRLELARRYIGWLLGGTCALSFGLCAWKMQANTSDCFYLLPYRAWELTIGALLAFHLPKWMAWGASGRPKQLGTLASHTLGIIGLLLIVGAMALIGKTTPFPGVAAIAPCLGAAMLIAAGARGHHWVGRLLALRPVVLIGLISYSVYLWHWPMLVFQNYLNLNAPVTTATWTRLAIGLSALPIGYLSWRFIEQPFRSNRFKGWPLFLGWGGISLVFIICTFAIEKTNGFDWRVPEKARHFLSYKNHHEAHTQAVTEAPPTTPKGIFYGDPTSTPSIALWGDSHAQTLAHEMGELANEQKKSLILYWRAANPPLVGFRHLKNQYDGDPQDDYEFNLAVLSEIINSKSIKSVVLSARWSQSIQGNLANYGPAEKEWGSTPSISTPKGRPFNTQPEREKVYAALLKDTILKLRGAGKTVFLIYPIPETGYDIPSTLSREVIIGNNPENFLIPAKKIFFERQKFVITLLDSLPDDPNLVRLKPQDFLIKNGHVYLTDGDKLFYSDSNHLSPDGAHLLQPLLKQVFTHSANP